MEQNRLWSAGVCFCVWLISLNVYQGSLCPTLCSLQVLVSWQHFLCDWLLPLCRLLTRPSWDCPLLSALSYLGWSDQVLAISEARLADLALCWSVQELQVMNSLFCLKLHYVFSVPTSCLLGTMPNALRFKRLWGYVYMYACGGRA